MTNAERLAKLKQAESLIREVEFSYPVGDSTRQRIYAVVVNTFSFMGSLAFLFETLKDAIKKEKQAKDRESIGRCSDPNCGVSTGICGSITYGTGNLDENGYWEHPCGMCDNECDDGLNTD